MPKKKTFKEQEFCFEDMPVSASKGEANIKSYNPENSLKDLDKVGVALLESLIANDTEAFIEILDGYLHVNRSLVAKTAQLSRSTIQQALSKKGNPTLKTLAKIIH